jgi:hypothetical protein
MMSIDDKTPNGLIHQNVHKIQFIHFYTNIHNISNTIAGCLTLVPSIIDFFLKIHTSKQMVLASLFSFSLRIQNKNFERLLCKDSFKKEREIY